MSALLATDPFPDAPPQRLRSTVWQYRFAHDGPAWWTREEQGPYCPVLTLDASGELIAE